MKKYQIFLSFFISAGCIFFDSVDQPDLAVSNRIFTVNIQASSGVGESEPYFGVCLPNGWSIPGDSIAWTGIYNE
ncbi:MAG: hypothetical protein HOG35_13380 [Candidatus Marinimicrobia bacterium]|jgi:hypothetical protein|nr:hypothetical protein [Candidatus Neomarinimicrobiota bacterium]